MGSRDHSETCDACGVEGGDHLFVCSLDHFHRMQSHAIGVRLAELGRQLVAAAALTRAYQLGWDPPSIVDGTLYMRWKPGCRKAAP